MVLSTHAAAGVAVASLVPAHPILGFVLAFLSHFLLDAIPHWDYKLKSKEGDPDKPLSANFKIGKNFLIDSAKMGFDLVLGVIAGFFMLSILNLDLFPMIITGAFGGVLPDILQFAYAKIRREPLTTLQKFHVIKMHSQLKITNVFWGISFQILIFLIFFAILYFVKK